MKVTWRNIGKSALRLFIVLAIIFAAIWLTSCAHSGPTSQTIAKMSCGAAAEAMIHAAARTACPRIRMERANVIVRSTGKLWIVVRLNVCGEKRVYEKRNKKWRDVTWRLK